MPPKKIQKGRVVPPPPKDTASATIKTPPEFSVKNPLQIPEVVQHVLGFLDSTDLVACFDVCLLWRALSAKNRAPIIVLGDFNGKAGVAYLESIRPPPIPANSGHVPPPRPMAVRFCFRNANLGSPAVKELLTLNGGAMEELELSYGQPKTKLMDFPTLGLLLQSQAPNLKTLIIRELPPEMVEEDNFPYHRQEVISLAADLLGHPTTTALKLTRIAVSSYCQFGGRSRLLEHLFTASPLLEDVQLIHIKRLAYHLGERIVLALIRTKRLASVKKLKFGTAGPAVINLLGKNLGEGQLRNLLISKALFTTVWRAFGPSRILPTDANALGKILTDQSGSMERLQLPLEKLNPLTLAPPWPPMPKLKELMMSKDDDDDEAGGEMQRVFLGAPVQPVTLHSGVPFNYAREFPRLRLIGVKGLLENFNIEEIYPQGRPPASTVRILQEIPLGVGLELMMRIVNLFPNLTIIRTPILYGCEPLLEAILGGCPGLVELYVTIQGDGDPYKEKEAENPEKRSLDAIFSGLPEADCRRLRGLAPEKLSRADFEVLRLGNPSVLNLQHLRRLCIDGPATTLGGYGKKFEARGDKLTDVFGVSTLWPLAAASSKEFRFFQGRVGVTDLGPPTLDRLQTEGGLVLVKKGMAAGYDPKCVRLIREGFGYESLGAVPPSWYGL